MLNKLTASEAIYGFCGWLTTRKEITVMSSHHDAAPIVELIKIFCEVHNLEDPKDNFADNLIPIKEKKND